MQQLVMGKNRHIARYVLASTRRLPSRHAKAQPVRLTISFQGMKKSETAAAR